LSFKFKGGNKGDKVSVTWNDNKGDSRTDEVVVA
jgi:sulfur-oxidizing protein SoxZ